VDCGLYPGVVKILLESKQSPVHSTLLLDKQDIEMSLRISGKTRVIGLLGWPVSHSLSPAMHNAAFEKAGLDFVYVCLPVKPENVGNAIQGIRSLGIAGCNVTIPHKEAVVPFLDEVSLEAQKVGAVNTIVNNEGRLAGYNTDVYGFLRSVEEKGISLQKARVVMIGAGGVAHAIAICCGLNGAASISLTDIVPEKALALSGKIKVAVPDIEVNLVAPGSDALMQALEKACVVVNATPLGMKQDDPLPLTQDQIGLVPKHAVIFDAVYHIKGTQLCLAAEKRDMTYIGGLDMLLYQGVRAFEIWTGITPDISLMKKVLQEKN